MKNNINSFIIGLSIIITALILGKAVKNRNAGNDSISVTGLGSKNFNSDLIVWSGSFTKRSEDLKDAYAQLDNDREIIKNYLGKKGIDVKSIIFSSITIEKEFDDVFDNNGVRIKSSFLGYRLRQNITIESPEVDKVESISREVSEIINSGVEFYSNNPEYYYTKLAELKIEMIAQTTKDANERAENIAQNADCSLGKLKKAVMGVFQIVAQNSSEEYSWGGSYNTSSKRKTATITVKLEYESE